ncbi:phospholipase D family protein [Conchiformibius kuhniae]|uniref:Phospholipase D family protein n=1 Tax=Conchiformibius kuhniae TaxID=211502 RepID=A0ABD8B7X2_9NEIS|nr:phospholipase D family protein [Conchiformibius kuhniae]
MRGLCRTDAPQGAAVLLAVLLLGGCRALPDLSLREPSWHIPVAAAPQLDSMLHLSAPERGVPPPNAHVYVLDHPHDAFTARAALIANARVALDVQYYIWRNDVSGGLLFQYLHQAAERGVRVRVLLDDNNTAGHDAVLAALDAHPNIQIRLFNPFLYRKWRFLGYLTDFPRLNRRMHNKSLTADNRVAIVGGRNIGDEYFQGTDEHAFADLDVLAAGGIVGQISADFDRYWQSDSAYPLAHIVRTAPDPDFPPQAPSPAQQRYLAQNARTPLARALARGKIRLTAAHTRLVSDDPAKALDRRTRSNIVAALNDALDTPARDLYLVSPYFVPTAKGAQILRDFAAKGVGVTVFTNSLRATDVAAVHSGYARYRKPLLQAGVQLYEFKPAAPKPAPSTGKKHKPVRDRGLTGSSATSLHAKTFIIDKQRVFVGSLNLDPRSARLNTEMGLVIRHPRLAGQMRQHLQEDTRHHAYRVGLNRHGRLIWHDPQSGQTLQQEPEAGFWRRWLVRVLSVLPIERLL